MIQWLGLHAFTAKDMDSISGQGTKIPQATWHGQKNKKQKKTPEPIICFGWYNQPSILKKEQVEKEASPRPKSNTF